jgi:NAD(P)H-dependent FMN reductase
MKIAVVVGATREGRVTDRLATWVAKEVGKQAGVEVLDLRDYPMPFFDEAKSPRYNPKRKAAPEVQKWLDKVAEFDGYVLVTPEYNRATSAVLKNSLDYLDYQMEQKPVALVGHGSAGGAQAIANLRMALPGVGAVSIPRALFFTDKIGETINDEGILNAELADAPYGPQATLKLAIESLLWYTEALAAARA